MGETPEGRNLFTQNGFHVNTWNQLWGEVGDDRRTKQMEKNNFFKSRACKFHVVIKNLPADMET